MDKLKFLSGIDGIERKNLFSLIFDRIKKSEFSDSVSFTPFLTPADAILLEKKLSSAHFENYSSFGGYDGAERKIYAFGECGKADFPLVKLKISTRDKSVFEHRDYLGSVLSLGIKRELVGDIVICDDCAVVFCHSEISDYIMFNLTRIANLTVTVDEADASGLTLPERRFEERSLTVSSMRLDCVLSAAANKSRTVSAELIERGMVCVNYDEVKNASRTVMDGDVISVRGIGKMLIHTDMSLTKKGKYHIEVSKYV